MAVKLRLKRMGKKRQPIYKVVAADARSPRDGKFIEAIGLYYPKTNPTVVELKEDRALYWLNVGAQPTDTVKNLLSREGILLKRELGKRGLSEDKIEAELVAFKKHQEDKLEAQLKKTEKKSAKVEAKKDPKAEDNVSEVTGTASDKAETEEKTE